MKLLILGGVLVVVCVVLFATGVIAPRRSRRLQRKVSRTTRKGERRTNGRRGWFARLTRTSLRVLRRTSRVSARGGRRTRRRTRSRVSR